MVLGKDNTNNEKLVIRGSMTNIGMFFWLLWIGGYLIFLAIMSIGIFNTARSTGTFCVFPMYTAVFLMWMMFFIPITLFFKSKVTAGPHAIEEKNPFYIRHISWSRVEKIFVIRNKAVFQIWIYGGSKNNIINLEGQFKEEHKERLFEYLSEKFGENDLDINYVTSWDPLMKYIKSLPKGNI